MATDKPMQLGMIGLGRMGANLVRRLMRDGHRCVVYDVNADAVKQLESEGATGSSSLEDFVPSWRRPAPSGSCCRRPSSTRRWTSSSRCSTPTTPSSTGATRTTATTSPGPSSWRPRGIHYLDCGTSGGVWGLDRGYCLMIGGETEVVERLDPIFKTIAPGEGSAEPTPEPDATRRHRAPRATCTAARTAPATSSRWSTTASSTG